MCSVTLRCVSGVDNGREGTEASGHTSPLSSAPRPKCFLLYVTISGGEAARPGRGCDDTPGNGAEEVFGCGPCLPLAPGPPQADVRAHQRVPLPPVLLTLSLLLLGLPSAAPQESTLLAPLELWPLWELFPGLSGSQHSFPGVPHPAPRPPSVLSAGLGWVLLVCGELRTGRRDRRPGALYLPGPKCGRTR